MTKNSAFKKDSESQHNTQNVDNSTPKWLTCRKLGKCFQFLKKKKKDNQQLQNDTDVEIIKFIGAILIMFQEIKVNTLEMDEKDRRS